MIWTGERSHSPADKFQGRRKSRVLYLLFGIFLLALVLLASLAIGARTIALTEVLQALSAPDMANPAHIVVLELRLVRTLTGLVVGSALAISGALIQTVTQNGLADPGILGINSGASFAAVIGIWAFGLGGSTAIGWAALVGAGMATLAVLAISNLGGARGNPTHLILGGAAVVAILGALTSAILLNAQEDLNTFRFWVVGSLSAGGSSQSTHILALTPFFAAGIVCAVFAARGLNGLILGETVAQSLGITPARVRLVALIGVASLAGAATAAAGPIGFLGLVAPHLARAAVGVHVGWVMLMGAVIGPVVLLSADILGRIALGQGEIQVGIMMAALGGFVFVAVIRRMRVLNT